MALQIYGLDDWKAEIRPEKTAFSVTYREEGEVVKRFNVPEGLNKSLPRALAVIEHELAHLFCHANREKMGFRLLQEFSTGRGEALSEAAAVWVEKQTLTKAFGMKRAFRGVYYWILRERERGGSFKDCFRAALLAQVGREQKDWPRVVADKGRFLKEGRAAFRRVLRVFRAGRIPLGDKSGFLVNSEELAYHEQELVVERLVKLGLEKFLFVSGVDIYSLIDLQRLGVLNWEEVSGPELVVAQEIWPPLKEELDKGSNLQEAITAVDKSFKNKE